jgi:hypothetical protein
MQQAVLEGELIGMGVDQDGEVRVKQFGDEFYMKHYLNGNDFNYNYLRHI